MERVIEQLRASVRKLPGVTVYFNPIQNLRLGGRISKSRYQYVLRSVSDQGLMEGAEAVMSRMRDDPMFRDVTSDAQLRGLQAQVDIDRDKANALGVEIQAIRTALYSAFGERQVSTIFTATDVVQGHHAGGRGGSHRREGLRQDLPARQGRRHGAACLHRHGASAHGSRRDQPPGPAPGDHRRLQPGPRRLARRGLAAHRAVQGRGQPAGFRAHRLGRRRGGLPGFAGEPGLADPGRAPRDLRAAGRALRELHPPDHDSRGPAFGRGRRAA